MATISDMKTLYSGGISKFIGEIEVTDKVLKGMDLADKYINTQSRVKQINDGLQTQAALQNKIFAAADRSRGSYFNMADSVANLNTIAGSSFSSNDETIKFAELMEKSFKLGGSSTQDQTDGMYQLTQTMGSGNLQGSDFDSTMKTAPMLEQSIEAYTGKSKDELKQMSEEGTLTADIIKGALFAASNDIDNKFAQMPMTFGDYWNSIKDKGILAFGGVMESINKIINTNGFQNFINGLVGGLNVVSSVIQFLIGIISKVGTFFVNNWSIISPIIWGIIGALLVYNAKMAMAWLTTIQDTAAKVAHTVASWAENAAILALIVAQEGFNAALAACPISWILIAIIALVAIFYAVIAAINQFAGTSLSATGLILGAFAVLGAFIFNTVIGVINSVIQLLWTSFAQPWIGIIEWVLNVFNGGFNSFGGAVANLLGKIISWFLSLGKVVTKIIDAIFGTNWTSGLSKLQDKVISWGKNDDAITLDRDAPTINKRINYTDAWNTAMTNGEKLENKFSSFADSLTGKNKKSDLSNLGTYSDTLTGTGLNDNLNGLGSGSNPLAVNGTGANGTVNVDMSEEDLSYLRDIAERDYINKFSTATLAPNIQVTFGDVHETADSDKLYGRIAKILQEEIATASEGVY
ncbi:tape measure protein [Anaerovorax odorimutans]|uniref:tape measure protein n=1 Tax=Anaerovorax odorimutans TaxID=109327 RepID=UPI000407AF2B|nr:tape measure protein [Anaerovorax odorimutans]